MNTFDDWYISYKNTNYNPQIEQLDFEYTKLKELRTNIETKVFVWCFEQMSIYINKIIDALEKENPKHHYQMVTAWTESGSMQKNDISKWLIYKTVNDQNITVMTGSIIYSDNDETIKEIIEIFEWAWDKIYISSENGETALFGLDDQIRNNRATRKILWETKIHYEKSAEMLKKLINKGI